MKMILNKRILRDFKANFFRNIAMILIIALSLSLVVSLCSSADCISATLNAEWTQCNVEDGSFETYIPLSKRNFNKLSELDVSVESMFYSDIPAASDSTLRIFAGRCSINLPYVEDGRLPFYDNEIFLEKKYAERNNYVPGSYISVRGESMLVSGTGCFPDYSNIKQNSSDVAPNDAFSLAIVTDSAFEQLKDRLIYNYAYKLGNASVSDLKDKLIHLKFDESAVKDTYLKEQLHTASNLKEEFNSATDALRNGAVSLADGASALGKAIPGADKPAAALHDGAMNLYSAICGFKNRFGRYLNESTTVQMVNLSSFGETKYNIRINDAMNDSQIGKQAALVVGVFLIILLVYMLAIFAAGTIEKERPIIGTLYALGYSRHEILSHYMKLPMIVSFLGAALGGIGGFLLTDTMSASSAELYSFPEIIHVFPPYLIAYSLGVPIIFSYIINYFMLSKKLHATPLKMMRAAPHSKSGVSLKLGNMDFKSKYIIRQFFRELSGNITLFFGIFISILLIMFSVACYGSIRGYIDGITDDIGYNYMYILRNLVSDLPKNPYVGYARSFYADFPMTGSEMEVTMLGIDRNNPYFKFASGLSDKSDKIYMSDSARIKFGYHVGDRVVLRDNSEDKLYAFEIAGEVKYGSGLYFFMNIDAMRKAFGLEYFDEEDLKKGERRPKCEDFYYNTVFSDSKLSFKHNMQLSELSKADMKSGAEKFMTLMCGMILTMIAVSVIIFAAVMYLLMKLEIDRSSFSISLLKALGYKESTVNSFYLGSSFYITLSAIFIGIPLCRVIVGFAYPFCVSNVNAGFDAYVSPLGYAIIIAITLISYFATRCMLVRYLRKIKLTEILKNRE